MEGDNDRVGDIRFQTRISAVVAVAVADSLIHSFTKQQMKLLTERMELANK